MNGFINLLKPPGMTSSQAVGAVRRLMNGEKAGHAGTLDPQAAGVLPIMAGRAARLFDYLVDKQKGYVAEIAFGAATDTQDAQGRVIRGGENYPSVAAVMAVLHGFMGEILQTPPAYSALKQDGQRLYDLARRGEEVAVQPRPVRIDAIELMGESENHGMMLHILCGRGTYIRTLCQDIGDAVGCPAHMRFLLRTQSGAFTLDNARTLEELALAAAEGRFCEMMLPMDMPLSHLPRGDVPHKWAAACRNGARISLSAFPELANLPEGAPLRLYLDDAFMGIASRRGEQIAFEAMLGNL